MSYSLTQYAQYIDTTEVVDNGAQLKLKVYIKPEFYEQHHNMLGVILKTKMKCRFKVNGDIVHYPNYQCLVYTAQKHAFGNELTANKLDQLFAEKVPEYV